MSGSGTITQKFMVGIPRHDGEITYGPASVRIQTSIAAENIHETSDGVSLAAFTFANGAYIEAVIRKVNGGFIWAFGTEFLCVESMIGTGRETTLEAAKKAVIAAIREWHEGASAGTNPEQS